MTNQSQRIKKTYRNANHGDLDLAEIYRTGNLMGRWAATAFTTHRVRLYRDGVVSTGTRRSVEKFDKAFMRAVAEAAGEVR